MYHYLRLSPPPPMLDDQSTTHMLLVRCMATGCSPTSCRLLEEHGQRERASTELSHLQARHESTVQESAEEASRLRTQLQQAEAALAEERQKHAATQDR